MEHTCFRKVLIMAFLYSRSNGMYYLAVTFQGKRIIRSLGTRSKSLANELVPILEREMYPKVKYLRIDLKYCSKFLSVQVIYF